MSLWSWINTHTAVFSQHAFCENHTFLYLALFQVRTEEEWCSRVWSIRSSTHMERFSAEERRAAPGPHRLQKPSKEQSKQASLHHSDVSNIKLDMLQKELCFLLSPISLMNWTLQELVRRISEQHITGAISNTLYEIPGYITCLESEWNRRVENISMNYLRSCELAV